MKKLILPYQILFALLCSICLPAHSLTIIFDLGDVLIETKYMRTIMALGWEFANYASTWQNPFGCHTLLFDFLASIKPRNPDEVLARDAHGHLLPQLMCDWLKGDISNKELLELIDTTQGTFKNWPQEALIRSLAQLVFTPKLYVKTRYILPEGIAFIKECKNAGHKVYILSNWDSESFSLLQEQHRDFFNLFDGIIISGQVGLLKPDPAIFELLIEEFNLNKDECIFLDDQIENVKSAQELGITSVLHQKKWGLFRSYPNFLPVCRKIKEMRDF